MRLAVLVCFWSADGTKMDEWYNLGLLPHMIPIPIYLPWPPLLRLSLSPTVPFTATFLVSSSYSHPPPQCTKYRMQPKLHTPTLLVGKHFDCDSWNDKHEKGRSISCFNKYSTLKFMRKGKLFWPPIKKKKKSLLWLKQILIAIDNRIRIWPWLFYHLKLPFDSKY